MVGRPPSENPRRHVVRYRLTAHEVATLTEGAAKAGQSVTDFARDKALAAAKRQR